MQSDDSGARRRRGPVHPRHPARLRRVGRHLSVPPLCTTCTPYTGNASIATGWASSRARQSRPVALAGGGSRRVGEQNLDRIGLEPRRTRSAQSRGRAPTSSFSIHDPSSRSGGSWRVPGEPQATDTARLSSQPPSRRNRNSDPRARRGQPCSAKDRIPCMEACQRRPVDAFYPGRRFTSQQPTPVPRTCRGNARADARPFDAAEMIDRGTITSRSRPGASPAKGCGGPWHVSGADANRSRGSGVGVCVFDRHEPAAHPSREQTPCPGHAQRHGRRCFSAAVSSWALEMVATAGVCLLEVLGKQQLARLAERDAAFERAEDVAYLRTEADVLFGFT